MRIVLFLMVLLATPSLAEGEYSYQLSGYALLTDPAGGAGNVATYVEETTLPDTNELAIAYSFEGAAAETDLEVYFNDSLLEAVAGLPLGSDPEEILLLDISAYRSQSGKLKIVMTSTGDAGAEMMILDAVSITSNGERSVLETMIDEPGAAAAGSSSSGGSTPVFMLAMLLWLAAMRRPCQART